MTSEAPGSDPEVRYASVVTAVGSMVSDFVADHGILVLFGEGAPVELHDMSVLHRPTVEVAGPEPGDVIELGDVSIPVLAVGSVVAQNLLSLGHLDLKANGKDVADLPGDVCVPEHAIPRPEVGTTFRILRSTSAAVRTPDSGGGP